ncbi:MAG: nuclear transport factor 2 family protein [candidate division Zixibacteria bacterium]|nr:nuclear transport factor 2 family protein [candidate division Zixibacteria bacterium]
MAFSQVQKEVWETVQSFNQAWAVDGDFDKLAGFFHENVIAITPTDRGRLEGCDVCVTAWRTFAQSVETKYWNEISPEVVLYHDDTLAIVTYYYDISYKKRGESVDITGRDLFTLIKENGHWLIIANQFSPFPKK